MNTQSEYQALAQIEVDASVAPFALIEQKADALVNLAQEYHDKVCSGEITDNTLNTEKVLRLAKRYRDRLEIAHAVAGRACAAAELNEGGK